MIRSLATAAIAAAALALVPSQARADWGIRGGLEAPLVTHASGGTNSISDGLQPGLDVMILKGPSDFIALGAELKIGFASTSNLTRTGTSIGPNLTINIPLLPLYARAALPIKIEPEGVGIGLRVAAGLKLNLPFIGFYLELFGDTPLAGKNSTVPNAPNPDAFSTQTFGAGLGVELRI